MSARTWFESARSAIFRKAAALAVVAGIALPAYGGGLLIDQRERPTPPGVILTPRVFPPATHTAGSTGTGLGRTVDESSR